MSTLNTLYQFWIHTRLVKRLPAPIEWVLNTASHHRVHHGVNPKYIDKNYAGIFIVWDRLLGTFQEEEEEPVYGTVKPLASWNPLWANVHYWLEIAALSRSAPRFTDKVRAWLAPPEWRPRELSNGLGYVTIPEVSRDAQQKYAPRFSPRLAGYVAVSFAVVTATTGALLLFAPSAPGGLLAVSAGVVLAEVVAWCGLFEGKGWGRPPIVVAGLRIVATVGAVAWFTRGTPAASLALAVVSFVSAMAIGWLVRCWPGERRRVASTPAV